MFEDVADNALRRRSQPYDYPSVKILDSYLRTSKRFDRNGNQVTFKGQTDRTKSPIENDLVEYLRQNGTSMYPEVLEHLSELGYSHPNINMAVMCSPLVHVDRINKDRESCAICEVDYPVAALVAAHKKKRAECTEVERTDPRIVMPLCRFECDFLYEEKYVRVETGTVVKGNRFEGDEEGRQYLEKLIGRRIEDEWLKGSSSYFL